MSNFIADFYTVEDRDGQLPKRLSNAIFSGNTSGVEVNAVKTGELYQIPVVDDEVAEIPLIDGPKALMPVVERIELRLFLVPEIASVAIGGYFESEGKVTLPDGQKAHYDLSTSVNKHSDSTVSQYNLELYPS